MIIGLLGTRIKMKLDRPFFYYNQKSYSSIVAFNIADYTMTNTYFFEPLFFYIACLHTKLSELIKISDLQMKCGNFQI